MVAAAAVSPGVVVFPAVGVGMPLEEEAVSFTGSALASTAFVEAAPALSAAFVVVRRQWYSSRRVE